MNIRKTVLSAGIILMSVTSQSAVLLDYHTFDTATTATDGGTVNPTLYATGVSISSTAKVGAGSLALNGTSSSRLVYDAASAAKLSDGPQFTIMFWAQLAATPTGSQFFYMDEYDNNLRVASSSGTTTMSIYAEGDNGVNTGVAPKSSLFTTLNTWHHVGIQYDLTAGTLDVFMDGVKSGSSLNISGFDDVSFNAFHIGQYAGQSAINGLIDDFAVVKGNLTSAEWASIAGGQSVVSVVPEPATLGLCGVSVFVAALFRRRMRV